MTVSTTEKTQLIANKSTVVIGFDSQKPAAATEQRATEALNLKKQEFELKRARFEAAKICTVAPQDVVQPVFWR